MSKADRPDHPNAASRFNEEKATYALKGADTPDLEAGIAAIRKVVKSLPVRPGVYRMLDARGDVLYVGKARALKNRVTQYTQVARQPKRLQRMVTQTRSMQIVTTNSEHFKTIFDASRHAYTVHGANVLGQVAAYTALNKCERWLADFVVHLQLVRDMCVDALNGMKGVRCIAPEGCYVAFADITGTGLSSAEMQALLLEKAKVAVVPGLARWFGDGAEGYIRLSFATTEEILGEALERIKNTINAI